MMVAVVAVAMEVVMIEVAMMAAMKDGIELQPKD